MATAHDAWWFSGPYLVRAVETWQAAENPSPGAIDAFYQWCLLMAYWCVSKTQFERTI